MNQDGPGIDAGAVKLHSRLRSLQILRVLAGQNPVEDAALDLAATRSPICATSA